MFIQAESSEQKEQRRNLRLEALKRKTYNETSCFEQHNSTIPLQEIPLHNNIIIIQSKLVSCRVTSLLKTSPLFTLIIIHSCMLQFASRLLFVFVHANCKANKFLNKELLWNAFLLITFVSNDSIVYFVCLAEYLFKQKWNFLSLKRDFFEDFSERRKVSSLHWEEEWDRKD